jgi:hypothetical protein
METVNYGRNKFYDTGPRVTRRLGKNCPNFRKKKPKESPNQKNATIYSSKFYFKVQNINPLPNSVNNYKNIFSPKNMLAFKRSPNGKISPNLVTLITSLDKPYETDTFYTHML